jgi:lipopolysaccharide cholinephosphotransferase
MLEKWNEYYSEKDIELIHRIEIESLGVFLDICKKLEIECFLYGGSLLGAIKYKGFVPWDDDLDLALMRADYEKIIKEAPSMLPNQYEIQHPRITKHTIYPYIKFRRKDTKIVEYKNRNLKINHGVYFDIYPIDNIPDDDVLYASQKKEFDKYVGRFQLRENWSLEFPIKTIKHLILFFINFLKHITFCFKTRNYYITKIHQIMTRYNDKTTKRQGNLFFPKLGNFFNGIFPLIDVEFEHLIMKIPNGYYINLINRYGDINVDPSPENRVGHRPYILDLRNYKDENKT